jgi:hypothetical protein
MPKLLILTLPILFCLACSKPAPKAVEVPQRITVEGTSCSMIPPDGFMPAQYFKGFEHDSLGATIHILELKAPYELMAAGFTNEILLSSGMTLTEKDTFQFQGMEATYAKAWQEVEANTYMKQHLVLKTGAETSVMIMAVYPYTAEEWSEPIKASLMSLEIKNRKH